MITKVGSFRSKATTGTMTFDTGLGVTPDAIYLLIGPPDSTGVMHDGISCGQGWVDSHGNQYGGGLVIPWLADYRGQRQDWANAESLTQAIFIADWAFPAAQVVHCAATVTAVHSDGTVTLNFTTVDGGGVQRTIGFFALSGVDAKIGSFAWSGGTVTVNPFSPNKTPSFVSLMVRPSTALLGMAHAPDYGTAPQGAHPGTPGSPRMASSDVGMWESQDGNGQGRGVQAYISQEFVIQGQGGFGEPGGVVRPAFTFIGALPGSQGITFDLYTATIITNGFTITKTINNVGSTLSSMHYMAVSINDATIRAEHEMRTTDPSPVQTDSSDLVAHALMGAFATDQVFPGLGAPSLEVAGWSFADADGHQVALYASIVGGAFPWSTGAGTADPSARPVLSSCGLFTDRMGECAHGTYVDTIYTPGGSGPTEHGKVVVDIVSDPNAIGKTYTYSNIAFAPRLGLLVLGPVKSAVHRRPQIYRRIPL